MGKGQKRKYRGHSSQDKKRRAAHAEQWKQTRGDAPAGANGGGANGGGDPEAQTQHRQSIWTTVFENKRLEAFYRCQHFLYDEKDFHSFISSLTRPLPACFRIASNYPFAEDMRKELMTFLEKEIVVEEDINPTTTTTASTTTTAAVEPGETKGEEQQPGEATAATTTAAAAVAAPVVGKTMKKVAAIQQIPWYPNGCGYQLSIDRRTIRKNSELTALHKWMIEHTDNGNITRQEAVSMVPPIALNVSPHHRCLDMCAAPGSKTSQLLEIIDCQQQQVQPHVVGGEGEGVVGRGGRVPLPQQTGLVVANDADTDRAYMLVHQCRRINSPYLIVTNHHGQAFPTIKPTVVGAGGGEEQYKSEFFDRILCDVPCSGDGTLRKNPTIWNKWSTANGAVIHPLQLMIAKRAFQLLKSDGLMVYSTCSMSPYENEAVVAELLRAHKGRLELVDARQFLPLFKTRPGLTTWKVLDDHLLLRKEMMEKKEAAKAKKKAKEDAKKGETETTPMEISAEAKEEEIPEETNPTDPATAATATAPPPLVDYSHITDEDLRRCLEMGFQYFRSYEEVPEQLKWKYRISLFPPNEEELSWMSLEKCLRCVPQDEDTGGFFVATLRKIPSTKMKKGAAGVGGGDEEGEKAEDEQQQQQQQQSLDMAAIQAAENGDDEEGGAKKNHRDNNSGGNNFGYVQYKPWDIDAFNKLKEFYGFDDEIEFDCFKSREDYLAKDNKKRQQQQNKNKKDGQEGAGGGGVGADEKNLAKTIYYLPRSVTTLLDGDVQGQLKTVTAGIKVFEKKTLFSTQAEYRLLQDGINFLAPHLKDNRKIYVTIQDFCNILGGGLVSYSTINPKTLSQITPLSNGAMVCIYRYSIEDVIPPVNSPDFKPNPGFYEFPVVCWKGNSPTVNVMCNKVDLGLLRHQLQALHVFRPKVFAPRRNALGVEVKGKEGSESKMEEEGEGEGAAEMIEEEEGENGEAGSGEDEDEDEEINDEEAGDD